MKYSEEFLIGIVDLVGGLVCLAVGLVGLAIYLLAIIGIAWGLVTIVRYLFT